MSAGVMGRWGSDDTSPSSPRAVAGAAPTNVIVNVPAGPQPMSKWKVAMWIGAIAAGWYWGVPMIRSYFRHGTLTPPAPPAPDQNAPPASPEVHHHHHYTPVSSITR